MTTTASTPGGGRLRDELRQTLRNDLHLAHDMLTRLGTTASSDRSRLLKTTQKQLGDWRAALDDLRVQSNLAEMASRERMEHAIDSAEAAWSLAQQRLDAARKDLGTSWEAIRDGINDAMRELADAVRVAIETLTQGTAH